MKNLLWIALAVIVLIGGYVIVTGDNPADMIDTTDETIVTPDALDESAAEVEAEADAAVADVDAAADEAVDEADAAADEAGAEINAAGDEIDAAADDAMNTAEETAGDAANEIEQGADAAAEGIEDAAGATADTAEDAADAVTDGADDVVTVIDADTAADAPPALRVDTFDMDEAVQIIDNSDMEDTQKDVLKTALRQAQDDPGKLETALEQVRSAMGM